MSEYIQLCKGGTAKLFKNDVEKREQFRIKYHLSSWNIVNRQTKEVLISFDDELLADDFFYTEKEIGVIWQNMRSQVHIEEGFTFNDLVKLIKEDSFLYAFVNANFTDFQKEDWSKTDGLLFQKENWSKSDGPLFVHTCAHINKFSNKLNFNYSITEPYEGKGIILNPLCICYEGSEKIHEYNYSYSLFDVISAFFSKIETRVKIYKNGIYDDQNHLIDNPFEYLNAECTIEEDVTLGDIFKIVENNRPIIDFLTMYSWCGSIDEFHKVARIPFEKKDQFTEILWHLEIYRNVEGSFSNFFNIEPSFHGVGDVDANTIKHYNDKNEKLPLSMSYGIEFSPMNELIDLPVIIKEDVKVKKKVLNLKYILLEILDAIYWEISFFGGPQDATDKRNDLSGRLQEIKNTLDYGNSKMFLSVDDMFKEICGDED